MKEKEDKKKEDIEKMLHYSSMDGRTNKQTRKERATQLMNHERLR